MQITVGRIVGVSDELRHPPAVRILQSVSDALQSNMPVVALESTIITHGMPHPANVRTARTVEGIVREYGSEPATIALSSGNVLVGMTETELDVLGKAEGSVKASKRDIGVATSKGLTCGTTVAATSYIAAQAGIRVFATGGLGGVHRGVAETWDISADLRELGRSPVVVVCAGVKSFLDVAKTLEYLETEGVPVVTFGDSTEFPGFYCSNSGFTAPYSAGSTTELASMVRNHMELCPGVGMVVGVPIPKEHQANADEIQHGIDNALRLAEKEGVRGRDLTPFVLAELNSKTGGSALEANINIIKNNAMVASKLAVELCGTQPKKSSPTVPVRSIAQSVSAEPTEAKQKTSKDRDHEDCLAPKVTVFGGSVLDLYAKTEHELLHDGTSYPGTLAENAGGVARNMADALTRLGISTTLISAIGSDFRGRVLQNFMCHMDLTCVKTVSAQQTGTYVGINSKEQVEFGIMDVGIMEHLTPSLIKEHEQKISESGLVISDSNAPMDSVRYLAELCHDCNIPLWFEPTDRVKALKILETGTTHAVHFLSPNWHELESLLSLELSFDNFDNTDRWIVSLKPAFAQLLDNFQNLKCCLITLGHRGLLAIHRLGEVCLDLSEWRISAPSTDANTSLPNIRQK